MSANILNIGLADNDGNGDPLRDAGRKLNVMHAVISRTTDAGAITPALGNFYIVPPGATGAFAGQDDDLAYYDGSAWEFYTPTEGVVVWVSDADQRVRWTGSAWTVEGLIYTPIAFRARAIANTTAGLGTAHVFGQQNFDLGNCFNPTTGVFTAPRAGLYRFSASGIVAGGATGGNLYIYVNGAQQARAHAFGHPTGSNQPYTAIWLGQLSAGDTVDVRADFAIVANSGGWNWFEGHEVVGPSPDPFNRQAAITASLTLPTGNFDGGVYREVDATSGNITITIPNTDGKPLTLVRIDGSANTVTLAAGSGVTLNAEGGTLTMANQWRAVQIIPRGSSSFVAVGTS